MPSVYGGFHSLHRLVKVLLGGEGLCPNQETSQQTVEVLHHAIAPGFPQWNEDRLYP
jgi:hypothetical protein